MPETAARHRSVPYLRFQAQVIARRSPQSPKPDTPRQDDRESRDRRTSACSTSARLADGTPELLRGSAARDKTILKQRDKSQTNLSRSPCEGMNTPSDRTRMCRYKNARQGPVFRYRLIRERLRR